MRHISFLVVSFLASSLSVHTCDNNAQKTDLNLDNKSVTDSAFSGILLSSPQLITFSALGHQLLAPQPVQCAFLTGLDLSKGSLRVFPIGAFAKAMPALKKLNLAYNKIISVASENDETRTPLFGDTIWCWSSRSLQELDVSHNQLAEFDLNIINNAPNLIKANFSHNPIAKIKIPEHETGEWGHLRHRQLCTVQLQNTSLSRAHRELLEKHSTRTTKEYEAAITGLTGWIIIASTFSALMVTLGNDGVGNLILNNPGLCMGYFMVSAFVVGPYIDYIIGRREIPENQRTYKQLILKFKSAGSNFENSQIPS
jgi:hypothetical protein